ncbi:N-acetyltransferase [Rhizobium sp. PP-F2F-G48]|uniref:GNAT family N-acetyltransferase n=1 Tax=Rhizobium sp. PP-F2F-G48 TaxID=2135651 RepID=UPI001051E291|nr:N-acetyltransferase [Rhizobium sp. PP-F2F-G48]
MSNLVNPADALPSFQSAFESGDIELQKCTKDENLFVHVDQPNGEMRLTYARVEAGKVTALVIYFVAEPMNGIPCFQAGWAVPEAYRNKGRAKQAVKSSLAELEHGFAKRGIIPEFYVEAVVGVDNIASKKVASTAFRAFPCHVGSYPQELK